MKNKKFVRSMVTFLAACAATVAVPASAASPSAAKRALQSYCSGKSISRYMIADLDRNGTEDMICVKNFRAYICTWNPKTRKTAVLTEEMLIPSGSTICCDAENGRVIIRNVWDSGTACHIFRLKGTRVNLARELFREKRNGRSVCSDNGRKISEAAFNRRVASFCGYTRFLYREETIPAGSRMTVAARVKQRIPCPHTGTGR